MIRQYELVERVKNYDPSMDEDALNRAYVYAMKMHGSQKRASGDPYFSHPLEVAGILTDMRLDTSTIITALLHDTIEDTDATAADIKQLFGDEVVIGASHFKALILNVTPNIWDRYLCTSKQSIALSWEERVIHGAFS